VLLVILVTVQIAYVSRYDWTGSGHQAM
jgi:hypothetical protein